MPSMALDGQPQALTIDGIDGPGGSTQMHITTGGATLWNLAPAPVVYTAALKPELQPGQFRRAVATAGITSIEVKVMSPPSTATAGTVLADVTQKILAVDADWDDESGLVELRVTATGSGSLPISFQVITFSAAAT